MFVFLNLRVQVPSFPPTFQLEQGASGDSSQASPQEPSLEPTASGIRAVSALTQQPLSSDVAGEASEAQRAHTREW